MKGGYMPTEEKVLNVLKMIKDDMKSDAEEFDGKEFNGKNVAEYFGRHGAAIAALANILLVLEERR